MQILTFIHRRLFATAYLYLWPTTALHSYTMSWRVPYLQRYECVFDRETRVGPIGINTKTTVKMCHSDF